MIFSDSFYPTPSNLIYKMLEWVDINNSRILEPSAGKGDILDKIKSMSMYGRQKLYAIEIEPELQDILRGKGYKVLDSDFLQYDGDIDFNLIIANFPFSNGDEHFLKAWNLLKNGQIVCLLNAETIKNPYSEKRKLIERIISDNGGKVEYIQNAFTDAERKTNVEVALIRISKVTVQKEFEFEGMGDRENINFQEAFANNGIQTQDVIGNIVREYNTAKELYAKWLQYIDQATKIAKSISDNHELKPFDIARDCNNVNERVTKYTECIKYGVWNKLIKAIGAEKFMTSKVREDFHKWMQDQGNIALTKNNIEAFIQNLFKKSGSIMDSTIQEVFDDFTKYHEENRVYIEGWKTNSSWKVNKKVILPYRIRSNWWTSYTAERTDDIDKVMCYLTWKPIESIVTIQKWVSEHDPGEEFTTTFFKCRYYKKQTLHITFLDSKLHDDFTMKAVYGKGWLPPKEKEKYEKSIQSLVKV